MQGTLTATLTWGLFGLVAGGLKSLAIWAILGAVCGGLWAYYTEHLLRKDELTRIGARLPASSSALVTFAETRDPRSLLKAAAASPVQVELVIWADSGGRRHVADPSQGVKAWAKADLISWGLFGVVVGALAGAFGGGGVHGFVSDAVVTGIGWAVFGLVAGALYGLWAGRAVSARRLKGLSGLLVPGTSMLVAWADGPVSADTIGTLTAPGSQRLILRFNAIEDGAVLEAA